MGLYLHDEDKFIGEVASTMGWNDVVEWCDTLPDECKPLIQFIEHGYDTLPKETIPVLEAAIKSHPPAAEGVESTLENLLTMMRDNQSAEILIVTDNVGIEEDEGDEDGDYDPERDLRPGELPSVKPPLKKAGPRKKKKRPPQGSPAPRVTTKKTKRTNTKKPTVKKRQRRT